MITFLKYLGMIILSFVLVQVLAVLFFYLRFLGDSARFPTFWVSFIPLLTAAIVGYLIFIIGKTIRIEKAKQLGIILTILWIVFLYFSIFLNR